MTGHPAAVHEQGAGGSDSQQHNERDATMLKKQTGYQVGDKWFDRKSEAAAYLAQTHLAELTEGFDADQHDVGEWMVEQGWPLINILSDIARRSAPPARAEIEPGRVNGGA